jgi:PKD domain
MKKNRASQSGFVYLRNLCGVLLCLVSVLLATLSFADKANSKQSRIINPDAIPPNGTVSPASPTLTYTGGPFVAPNVTAQAGPPICTAPMSCDDFILTVDMSPGPNPDPAKQVKIVVSWPVSAADFDLYVLQNGSVIATSASSADPEVVVLPALSTGANPYTIRVVPFAPAGQSYTATVTLENRPVAPPPGSGPAPRYKNYTPNPVDLGGAGSAGEPSIGIDWIPRMASLKHGTVNTGGVAFFTANLNEYRVSFDDCSSPAKNPNVPMGAFTSAPLWEDVTSPTEGVVSLDPIGFVDHQTGRVFQSQLAGASSILAFSDNDGGINGTAPGDWTQSQGSGQPAGVDHQTVGGGPYNNLALPPPPPHPLYANQVYYASQDIGTAFAARSDNGGATFGPGVPMWTLSQCGGLHGHVKVGPDGTVYVPNRSCNGGASVAVSTDNGLTWTIRTVHEGGYTAGSGSTDPSIGIGADNTIYLGYENNDGVPHIAVSTDKGVNWHDVPIGQGVFDHAVFPEVVAGDGDRAAFGFLGTTGGGTGDCCSGAGIGTYRGVWYFYIATTFDRGQTYTLVNATGNDPVQIGSLCTGGTLCGNDRNLLDFNDIQIDSEGRVLAGYADGCVAPGCSEATANSPPDPTDGYTASRSALSSILRQSGGPRLLAAYDSQVGCTGSPPVCPSTVPRAPRVDSVTGSAGSNVHLDWSEPDHGGADVPPPTPTAALTGYKVYRRTNPGVYGAPLATITIGCPACKTDYDDGTTLPGTVYFYKVTALNAVGESTNCDEFTIGTVGPVEKACLLPGLTILTDGTGDEADAVVGHDVEHLWIAEPAAFAPNQLVFTLKMQSLATVPPSTRWPVTFTSPNNINYTVRMTNVPADYPVGCTTAACVAHTPIFQYGPTAGPFVTIDPTAPGNTNPSNFLADGTITIAVPRSGIGNPQTGQSISGFLIRICDNLGAACVTPDNMPDNFMPGGSPYTLVGNLPCNREPVAALSANPISGEPPLVVNFNASASSDPDTSDTIASYTFDFGDGSAPVTQAGATIAHTYQSNGHFHATVRVTDNHGLASLNLASVEIEVELPLDRVVSRKAHNGAAGGPFEVVLFDPSVYPNGTGEIECRTPEPENDYTIIYTFGTEFTVTGSATSVTVDGAGTYVSSHMPGPGTNRYTVHVSPTVPNAKHHTITIDGVPVTNSNQGGAPATLKNAIVRFDLLVGDTNGIGNGLVNSTDVSQVQAESGHVLTSGPTGNFRTDVTANGQINSSDVSTVQQQSGTGLSGGVSPPPSKPGPRERPMPREGRPGHP